MANSNMTPADVCAEVNKLDMSKPTTNAKAVQKGTRLSERSSAGNQKESGFMGAPNSGKHS